MNQLMIEEALEAPTLIRKLLETPLFALDPRRLQDLTHTITIARGSSDHAAQFMSYLLGQTLGLVPASLPPSLLTLHKASLRWKGALAVAVSQSGASPDLCEAMQNAREGGALTLALINQPGSRLADCVEHVYSIGAGEERSVAATKTFLLSLVTILRLVAHWTDDGSLHQALFRLPALLEDALQQSANATLASFQEASSVLVVSRGPGLAVAQEIALKMNEVCRLPALAYSSAELRHGPMALLRKGDPVLLIGLRGPELSGLLETRRFLESLGAKVIWVAPSDADIAFPADIETRLDPIVAVQILYPLIAKLAVLRGYNPDEPAHLRKVTLTL